MTVTSRVLVALFLVFASVASSFRYGTIRRATSQSWLGMIHFNENIEAFDSVLYDMPVSNNGARVRMVLKEKGLLDGHHIVIRYRLCHTATHSFTQSFIHSSKKTQASQRYWRFEVRRILGIESSGQNAFICERAWHANSGIRYNLSVYNR